VNIARSIHASRITTALFKDFLPRGPGVILKNMELYLLRHGLAVERGAPGFKDDSTRPLTPKGRRQLRKITAAIKKMDLRCDQILSSPLVRAKQTAEIVAAGLKLKKQLKFSNALAPAGSPAVLFRQLARLKPSPKRLLLVGHEPGLSRLVSRLITGGLELQLDFKKGGLCKLEVETLRDSKCAKLVWLLTPKQLKMM
jgi:phosphohistidine phosphatase